MNGWILGYVIGAAIVAAVVVLLLLMIRGASRVAQKAEAILAGLHDVRDNTEALWQVQATVTTADRIVAAASDARLSLTPGGRS